MFENTESVQLIVKWPKVQKIPYIDYEIRIDGSVHPIINKSNDVLDFLSFFKLIPTHRVKFQNAVDSFIVFSEVSYI